MTHTETFVDINTAVEIEFISGWAGTAEGAVSVGALAAFALGFVVRFNLTDIHNLN